jgi:ABC-type spermidine/putrescine transport system permease subunit I
MTLKLEEQWGELFALSLLVIGFIVAILLRSAFFNYITAFVAGFLSARLYLFKRYKQPILPFILIIVGFLLGYLIGTIWASRIVTFVFFAVGFAVSYYLHKNKIIGIFKSEPYLYK